MEEGRGKDERGNGRYGTVHGGKGKEEGGREERGYSPSKLQFLAPPLAVTGAGFE